MTITDSPGSLRIIPVFPASRKAGKTAPMRASNILSGASDYAEHHSQTATQTGTLPVEKAKLNWPFF